MWFMFNSINRKILALTLSLVIGASLIIGLTALFVFYEHSLSTTLNHNQELAENVAEEVHLFINDALKNNEKIAGQLGRLEVDGSNNLMETLCSGSGIFDGFALVNGQGFISKFYPLNQEIIGADLSERLWFKNVMTSGRSFVSEPYLAKTGQLVLVTASPVKDGEGKVIGVLSGSIHLIKENKLRAIMKTLRVGKTGYGCIFSTQGNYIYHPDEDNIMLHARYTAAVEEALLGKSGSVEVKNEKGISMLAGYAPIPNVGWGVVVQIPREEAVASAHYLRTLLLLIIVSIIVVVLIVTFIEVRRVTRPLTTLLLGVHRVTEGDYAFEVEVNTDDEIGSLTKAFNYMVKRTRAMREDIEEKQRALKAKNEELKVLAITDGLTKLYNHRYFQERLKIDLENARRAEGNLSLMLIDIDHFKYYNDLFGHQAGDKLLVKMGEIIKSGLSPRDFPARYGGEEFAVIMPAITAGEAFNRAEFIRKVIEEYPFEGGSQQPNGKVTVSIGLAAYPDNAGTKEELFKKADEALYKAKCCSRNKVELYFSVLDELSSELNRSEVELINSMKMLVRIINAADKYTYGHSERVSGYAVAIAERLSFSKEELRNLKMGAFLHDIGKIEVSREILTKKGALSAEEFEIIKKHPFWGAAIIKAVEALAPTLPIIKFHHERLNGSGYPLGLKGEEIPLTARILAVADSFDAMTSNRPYRSRMSIEEAKNELLNNSGILFDPKVVGVFLELLEQDFRDELIVEL